MSRVIYKMTFKHPNLPNTSDKNVSHINYIARRAGVDKSITESDLKNELQKGVENLCDDDYVKYINERPRSHGLFGQDGIENPEDVQKEIGNNNGYVWRSIVSLKEEDATKIGYLSKEPWQEMLRNQIPKMADEMGVKFTNLRWVAAVHMEKGHPHAHIVMWEKTPIKMSGIINKKKIENIRKSLTDEIFEEERQLILNEKNAMRDFLNELTKKDISEVSKLIKESKDTFEITENKIPGVHPKIFSEYENELSNKLKTLSEKMPKNGRVSYEFMPSDIKEELNNISEYLLSKAEFASSVTRNIDAAERLARLYTSDEKYLKRELDNYKTSNMYLKNNLIKFGLDKSEANGLVKRWFFNQDHSLSEEKVNEIFEYIDNNDIEKISSIVREKLDVITFKLIEGYKKDFDMEKSIKEYCNPNIDKLSEMIKNRIIIDNKDGSGSFSVSKDMINKIQRMKSLGNPYKEILDIIGDNKVDFQELLKDKKLNSLLKANILEDKNKFRLGKYDATIIRGYFGKNNLLSKKDLKNKLVKKYKSNEKAEKEYNIISKRIDTLINNNIIKKTEDKLSFTDNGINELESINKNFEFTSYDSNIIYGYFNRANGELSENGLYSMLKEEYTNKDQLDKQFNYLLRRVDKNKECGYIEKVIEEDKEYFRFTKLGEDKVEAINKPEVKILKDSIKYLFKNKFIEIDKKKISMDSNIKYIIDNNMIDVKEGDRLLLNEIADKKGEILKQRIEMEDIDYKKIMKLLKLKSINNPIDKVRENAMIDLKKRVGQIILKGAVEAQKENLFYVDDELANKAVKAITSMNRKIDNSTEILEVFKNIAHNLFKVGYDEKQVFEYLIEFKDKENISYPNELIQGLAYNNKIVEESYLTNDKKINDYLATFKLVGIDEEQSFKNIEDKILRNSNIKLYNTLKELKGVGLIKKINGKFKMTNKGIEEFLKVKTFDTSEKNILLLLEEGDLCIRDIIKNDGIFSSLYYKGINEIKLGKFDLKIKEEFGENNKLNFNELEKNIYEKYTDKEKNINLSKAEKEFEYKSSRIKTLCLNGYIKFDKNLEEYRFTQEGLLQLENISEKMEFTKYDATETLGYMDRLEGNLRSSELNSILQDEIVNKNAERLYNRFNEILKRDKVKKFVSNENGVLKSTEEGKWLSINLNKLNKYFYASKGVLTNEKLKELCIEEFSDDAEKHYNMLIKILHNEEKRGHVIKEGEEYRIEQSISDIKKLLFQIYKEGGEIDEVDLKDILEKNIPNKDAERQFKYLIKRLDNLKELGYVDLENNAYSMTEKGCEKREDLLIPERKILKNRLDYLERLGMVKVDGEEYGVTDKYYDYMKEVAYSKENGIERTSNIEKSLYEIIDKTQDEIDVDKINRVNLKILRGKYYNDDYSKIESTYERIRETAGITDITSKTLKTIATTLLISGIDEENTKKIIYTWNQKSNSDIDEGAIDSIVEKANEVVSDNNIWGKVTLINTKDWKEAFQLLGFKEDDIPQWIYKGYNWERLNELGIGSIVNKVWKAVWNELEKQRLQSQSEAEYMRKQITKQHDKNISAQKEQLRKNKDGLYREDELEI